MWTEAKKLIAINLLLRLICPFSFISIYLYLGFTSNHFCFKCASSRSLDW